MLSDGVHFSNSVKEVILRIVGPDRAPSPVDHAMDTFFLSEERLTDDFMTERDSQQQQERELFDS